MATGYEPAPAVADPTAAPAAFVTEAGLQAVLARIGRLRTELGAAGSCADGRAMKIPSAPAEDPLARLDLALRSVRALAEGQDDGRRSAGAAAGDEVRDEGGSEAEDFRTTTAEVVSAAGTSDGAEAGEGPPEDDASEGGTSGIPGPVRYEVDDPRFMVDAEGVVRVRADAAFDQEKDAFLDIVVTAVAADGSADRQSFTVRVDDLATEETVPPADAGPSAEEAVDDARDPGDPVAFEVDDPRFTVDADGVVRVAPGARFDLATEAEVALTVSAHAADGTSSLQVFTVRPADFADGVADPT